MSVMSATLRDRRLPLRAPFLVAFAAAALAAGLGRAVTTTYLPLLLNGIDDEPGLIGTVMLVNAGAGMVVPLVTGLWSDRRAKRGRGRRLPFVAGGALVTAGGLAAVALGSGTSYLVLALAGAVVYTGLNALTTAHRALVPEIFDASGRAKATSAQELAMLGGGLVGLAVGGLLTGLAPWAPFALAALLVPVLALPTLLRTREPAAAPDAVEAQPESFPAAYYLRAASRPGVRGFLTAQVLWVLGYAALPAFFLLYAEEELGLRPAVASLWLAGFGLVTGAAIAAAGRVRDPERHRPLLLVGVALLGIGFLGVAATTSLTVIAAALIAAAVGFGLISTLGFPLFSAHIPEGESGGYTALYFSVRAIAATIALPAAGWIVEASGSYRALFVLGGVAALTALLPLVSLRRPRGRAALAGSLLLVVPLLGLLVAQTPVHRLDEELYLVVNGLGPGPDFLWELLDPHTRNYLVLIALAVVAGALARSRRIGGAFARVMGAALLSWALLEAVYSVYDRRRPEEVLGEAVELNGSSWAHLNSFPSGHMAITAALAVSIALAFPRLRALMWGYVAAVAFTRVMFGAHFPLDTVAGTALGTASALLVAGVASRWRPGPSDARPAADGDELDPGSVVAVMPSYDDVPDRALLTETLDQVGGLVLVDDGSSGAVARQLDELAESTGAELVRLPENSGKGNAVRAGIAHALDRGATAVLVIDADGQHPPAAIPGFLAAGQSAELVIGDRFGDLRGMPRQRRLANRTSRRLLELATGRQVRDTQNGMRLMRGRALELLPPAGGYEAETRHLKLALREGVPVGWVPMPAIYAGERSSFRALRDSAKVVWAIVGPAGRPSPSPAR
jgi:membrane-associated phospholipid phosphatase/predicted MFS family arabinose efflux permease